MRSQQKQQPQIWANSCYFFPFFSIAPPQFGCPSLASRMRGALCHSLPVVLGLLLCHPTTASGPCWENSKCQDLATEAGVLVSGSVGMPRAWFAF